MSDLTGLKTITSFHEKGQVLPVILQVPVANGAGPFVLYLRRRGLTALLRKGATCFKNLGFPPAWLRNVYAGEKVPWNFLAGKERRSSNEQNLLGVKD
eukprot:1145423-Pelagomonas_calceolata.AAC.1